MSQVVSGRMSSGTWCNLVSNAPGGGGCWKVISANLSLLPVTATPSLKGISWAWERAELPSSLVREGTWANMGTGQEQKAQCRLFYCLVKPRACRPLLIDKKIP